MPSSVISLPFLEGQKTYLEERMAATENTAYKIGFTKSYFRETRPCRIFRKSDFGKSGIRGAESREVGVDF